MSWEALDLALALHAHPKRVEETRARPLPSGVTNVLRLALAHEATLDSAVATTGLPAQQLIDASIFFVEQLMLARECQDNPWRVLGVARDSDIAQIREHHRLLMRLVHPDRGDEWALAYADRVNKSWRQLRHEQGREEASERANNTESELARRHAAAPIDLGGNDAWAVPRERAAPVQPQPVAQHMLAPLPAPVRRGVPWLGVAAIVGVVGVAIAGGFWLGVERGQQLASTTTTDDIALDEPVIPPTAETPPLLPPPESILPDPAPALELAAESVPAPRIDAPDVAEPAPTAAMVSQARMTPPARVPSPPPASATREHDFEAVAQSNMAPPTTPAMLPAADSTSPADDPVAVATESPAQTQPSPAPANSTAGPSDSEAAALLDQYQRHYADGDLGGVLGLFAREVHAEDQRIAAIAKYYARLFDSTSERVIAMHDLRWQRSGDHVLGSGLYQARHRPKNKLRYETIDGVIEIELIHNAGSPRLLKFNARPAKRS